MNLQKYLKEALTKAAFQFDEAFEGKCKPGRLSLRKVMDGTDVFWLASFDQFEPINHMVDAYLFDGDAALAYDTLTADISSWNEDDTWTVNDIYADVVELFSEAVLSMVDLNTSSKNAFTDSMERSFNQIEQRTGEVILFAENDIIDHFWQKNKAV